MLVSDNVSDVLLVLRKSGAGKRGRQLLSVKEPDASNTARWQKLKGDSSSKLRQHLLRSLSLWSLLRLSMLSAIPR
jgi:hypothetical protein